MKITCKLKKRWEWIDISDFKTHLTTVFSIFPNHFPRSWRAMQIALRFCKTNGNQYGKTNDLDKMLLWHALRLQVTEYPFTMNQKNTCMHALTSL